MNILYVTPGYPRRGEPTTGFPNYLYRVSLSLVKMGHKAVILTAGEWNSHRIEQGIEIWTVQISTYDTYKSQALTFATDAIWTSYVLNQKIKEMLKSRHFDIIQFTSLCGIACFYHGNVPAVLRLSSYAKTSYATFQTYTKHVVNVMSVLERASSRRCSAVFAPCKNTADAFGRDCNRNVKVIETPFVNDVQKYNNQYVDAYLKGKKYVLFFGSLYIEKGILVIADILENFLRNNPDYYFVFIGAVCRINGQSAAQIIQESAGICESRTIISTALPHEQLYPVIRNAEFVVLPSLMENLSNACIEAMYFERLVIGTNGASFEQLITHGVNGLLCRIGDSKDLLEKMQMAVLMDEEHKKQIGKLARKRIDKLKPEYVVRRLLRLYEYVIANSKR